MIRDFIGDQVQSGVLFDGTYGLEIETESKQFYDPPEMKFWSSKVDGSLRDVGYEYILKVPLRYGKELNDGLEEFKKKTEKIKFIQDSNSTSVHVHVNMLPETWKTMANFLTLYTLVENVLIEVSGEFRRNNLFCLPIRSVPYVITIMKEIFENVSRKNYRFNKQIAGEREQNAIKYAALNLGCLLRFGSVEIRSFRGVTDTDVIHSWVSIINQMLEYARMDVTPDVMLSDYQKKDIRFLKDVFKDYWDLIKYDNMKELIEPNLWYAGDFGYRFNAEGWNKLDIKAEKIIKKSIKRDMMIVNLIARDVFGRDYLDLENFNREVVVEMYDNDAKNDMLHVWQGRQPIVQNPNQNVIMQNPALEIPMPVQRNDDQPRVNPDLPRDWLDQMVQVMPEPEVEQPQPKRRRRAQINLDGEQL